MENAGSRCRGHFLQGPRLGAFAHRRVALAAAQFDVIVEGAAEDYQGGPLAALTFVVEAQAAKLRLETDMRDCLDALGGDGCWLMGDG